MDKLKVYDAIAYTPYAPMPLSEGFPPFSKGEARIARVGCGEERTASIAK
jgi:hypothetical protein